MRVKAARPARAGWRPPTAPVQGGRARLPQAYLREGLRRVCSPIPGSTSTTSQVVRLPNLEEAEAAADDRCVLAAAAFVDGVRLIDHLHLSGSRSGIPVEE